jgi:uncharacterized protein YecT (DUF1311 family)
MLIELIFLCQVHCVSLNIFRIQTRQHEISQYAICTLLTPVLISVHTYLPEAPMAAPGLTPFRGNMKRLLLAVLFSASGAAFANSACDKPKNDFDGLYCLNKVYQEADNELNANYKNLSGKLDAQGRQSLKTGQLAWIQNRNQSCSKSEGEHFYVNLRCATSITIARAQFLQDRIRECTSSGCRNSKL